MNSDPALRIQDYLVFGEFGGVNPSITDSSTFTFLTAEKMKAVFEYEIEGCYLYSRHLNPMNNFLGEALAQMEGTESALVTSSGMGAISAAILQLCNAGDEIVSARTIYGGTYALMLNFLPKFNINTKFIDITNLDEVRASISPNTKIIYCETLSNPILESSNIVELAKIAKEHNLKLVVDNTFTPLIISPSKLGADVVIHSLTKYINGSSDCVAGVICGTKEFITALKNVNDGAAMLLGPTPDSLRSASILKNLHTLHIRMHRHSENAMFLAKKLEESGLTVIYPGLNSYKFKKEFEAMKNEGYAYSGLLTIDTKDAAIAEKLLARLQEEKVGYFAVSLGFYKTLFSIPGESTSSELPDEMKKEMGLSPGLCRFSVGLDNDMETTWERMKKVLVELELI